MTKQEILNKFPLTVPLMDSENLNDIFACKGAKTLSVALELWDDNSEDKLRDESLLFPNISWSVFKGHINIDSKFKTRICITTIGELDIMKTPPGTIVTFIVKE